MAMNFAQAGQRVRSLLAPSKPANLSKSALTPDALRDNIVAEAAGQSERFQNALKQRPDVTFDREVDGVPVSEQYEWDTFPELMRDFARAAFGWDEPEVVGREKVRPSHRFNREVLSAAVHTEGFAELRPHSRNNELESMYGAMTAAQSLIDAAPELLAEHAARSEAMAREEETMDSAEAWFDRLRQRAKDEVAEHGAVQDTTRRDVKKALRNFEQAQQALGQLMTQEATSSMTVDAIAAGQQAARDANEAVDALGMVPGVGGGNAQLLSPDQQIALAEKWAKQPDLRKIARMMGRLLTSMTFKRQARVKNVKIEPVGVTTGNDLQRLLPHELARAFSTHKPVQALFLNAFANRSLLQRDMRGKAPAGKGPIIEVHDGSGSMAGEKFVWASSLGLALLTIAQREQRHFAGIEFGSHGQLAAWQFAKGVAPDPDDVLAYAGHFFGGGTHTATGMAEALRIIEAQEEFKTADVVLIGDGQDHFSDDAKRIRDRLRELGVRIHGITIGTGRNPYFDQMCDWHTDVTDLAGANDATDQLAANIT
jgi:uncharacterized protein with von Willebrand factor type A (vWA) domain